MPVVHLLSWPKRRVLTTGDGVSVVTVVEPGRLRVETPAGEVLDFSDPDELRAFAMQVYVAALDRDQSVQFAAARRSAARRAARSAAGDPVPARDHLFTDPPEPPIHMEVPA